jgi:class 3 adenylate cyclase
MVELLNQIETEVVDIFSKKIETSTTSIVPSRDDAGLTFPISGDKQGKLIETCILFVDIRNSTKLSRSLQKDKVKLGKIYSAFVHTMVTIADEFGFVRNIVGDRVMVVFDPENCFSHAIDCAAAMYTAATKIIKKHCGLEDFSVGIGIDHGEMLILKTGIKRKHEERSEYKGLVWIGDTANTASKLTDFSNKAYSVPSFKVRYEDFLLNKKIKRYGQPEFNPLLLMMNGFAQNPTPIYEYESVKMEQTANLSPEEFAKNVVVGADGWTYEGKKVTGFGIEKNDGTTPPVLMSGKVFNEFKKAAPKSPYLAYLSKKEYPNAPSASQGIYGGSLFVKEFVQQIKK